MIRRPRRTVPATVVGLVLLVGAVLVAISCIQVISGSPPLIPFAAIGALGDTTWNNPAVLAAGAGLALIGVVLLACALLPGAPQVLALAAGNDHTDAGVARHTLARDLTSRARAADGITGAHVAVGARKVKVAARTALQDRSGLSEGVRKVVTERLDDINLARRPRLTVTVAKDRSAR